MFPCHGWRPSLRIMYVSLSVLLDDSSYLLCTSSETFGYYRILSCVLSCTFVLT